MNPTPPQDAQASALTVTVTYEDGTEGDETYDTVGHAWQYKRELCFFDRSGRVNRMPLSRVVLWRHEVSS